MCRKAPSTPIDTEAIFSGSARGPLQPRESRFGQRLPPVVEPQDEDHGYRAGVAVEQVLHHFSGGQLSAVILWKVACCLPSGRRHHFAVGICTNSGVPAPMRPTNLILEVMTNSSRAALAGPTLPHQSTVLGFDVGLFAEKLSQEADVNLSDQTPVTRVHGVEKSRGKSGSGLIDRGHEPVPALQHRVHCGQVKGTPVCSVLRLPG